MKNKTHALPQRPHLSISYHIIPMDNDRVQFRNGHDVFVIKGPGLLELIHALMPLLTGQFTMDEVIQRLEKHHARENILGVLHRLVQRRVVKETIEASVPHTGCANVQNIFYSHFTQTPQRHLAALSQSRVTIVGLGPLGASLCDALARSGIGSIEVADDAPVTQDDVTLGGFPPKALGTPRAVAFVTAISARYPNTTWTAAPDLAATSAPQDPSDYIAVCLETYRPDILKQINAFSLACGTPYTWCSLDCQHGSVGPTVLPQETACFECYSTRVKANADHPDELSAYEDQLSRHGNPTTYGFLPPHVHILAGIASLEIIKDLSGLTPPLTYNAQLEINLLSMEFALHPVLKLPRCPACTRLQTAGAPVRPFAEMEA
jgi:thiazole/oxazole-forming peptide maturase SagC family component